MPHASSVIALSALTTYIAAVAAIAAAVGISTGDGTANDRGWGIRWQWNCRPDVPAETASVQVNTAAAAEPAAAEA